MSTTLAAGTATSGAALSSDTSGILQLQSGSTSTTGITLSTAQSTTLNSAASTAPLITQINGTEVARVDSSGNLLVGGTSASFSTPIYITPNNGSGYISANHATGTPSGNLFAAFNYNAATIGSITQSGTTAVLYNTTSDYRLKANVQPVTSGLSIVNQLNPVNFTWISDNSSDTGFLAHEFQSVIPRAVTGVKDAVDADGKPVYQQMDNSGAVPYLVAAIKELSAQVTTLQSQVAALTPKA